MSVTVQHLAFLLFPFLVALGAATDATSMAIPNRLSLVLALSFVFMSPLAGLDWAAFAFHFAAGGIVLVTAFTLFAAGWIGGGDAKFAAAIALWLGYSHLITFVVAAAICGGTLTLAILTAKRTTPPFAASYVPPRLLVGCSDGDVPFGVALAAAALMIYPHTVWIRTMVG